MNGKKETEKVETPNSSSGSEWEHHMNNYGEFEGEVPQFIGIGPWSPQTSRMSLWRETRPDSLILSSFEAALMRVILEDAIKELFILKYVIGDAINEPCEMRHETRLERFTRRLTPQRIFPEIDAKVILTPTTKLQRDRNHVEYVISILLEGLRNNNTIGPLISAIDFLHTEKEDEVQLIEELKENLIYLKYLKSRVEEKRRLDDQEEKERDEFMYHLQDEMDDVILKCEVEEKFVNKWENVRIAQNQWKLRNSENFYKDNIAKFNTKSKIEKRVTHELQLYLKFNLAELEEQLEEWMSVYDVEMERRENKIIQLKYDRDQEEEKKARLHQLFESRKKEMKEWVTFRDNRRRKMKASLIIQSWWRGMMVRKKLGPYKPKKLKPEPVSTKKK